MAAGDDSLTSDQEKVLRIMERTFKCYITEDPKASTWGRDAGDKGGKQGDGVFDQRTMIREAMEAVWQAKEMNPCWELDCVKNEPS